MYYRHQLIWYRKYLLHPDPERPYTELFIVSMPSDQIKLTSVPGTEEPASQNPAAATLPGRGVIPAEHRGDLLAAFNGGFRAEHGHHVGDFKAPFRFIFTMLKHYKRHVHHHKTD
mgnify:CR=1 FL=1